MIEPAIAPLGFNWKIGIGLIGSLLQREVFVSTMGTIFNIGDTGDEEGRFLQSAGERRRPGDRGPFVFDADGDLPDGVVRAFDAMLSTVAIMRRETNGWRWPLIGSAI